MLIYVKKGIGWRSLSLTKKYGNQNRKREKTLCLICLSLTKKYGNVKIMWVEFDWEFVSLSLTKKYGNWVSFPIFSNTNTVV